MDPIARFGEYAAAFEVAFEKDDWSVLEPFFTADAVYETLGEPPLAAKSEGRQAVFAHLKGSLDAMDRRFDTRELELLQGPELRDGDVWIRWRGTYTRTGAPPLAIEGEETVRFQDDRILRLEDRFADGTGPTVLKWMGEHGAKLKPPPA